MQEGAGGRVENIYVEDAVDGSTLLVEQVALGAGTKFSHIVKITDVVPRVSSTGQESHRNLDASIRGLRTIVPLRLRFIANLPDVRHEQGRAHFDISIVDGEVVVGGTIPYTRGWMHYIIRLGEAVPSNTGGLIDANVNGSRDWRYCQEVFDDGGQPTLIYWNGAAWVPVPPPPIWTNPIGTKLWGMGVWDELGVTKTQFGKLAWPVDPLPQWSAEALDYKDDVLDDAADATAQYWTHLGIIHQKGRGHAGTLQQNGNSNAYGLFQFGKKTRANVSQNGNGNAGATFQFGW
jgi:hypothetical protein